ncbi:MAG: hypothetical protein QM775_18855 [Pirellulales bacterium]
MVDIDGPDFEKRAIALKTVLAGILESARTVHDMHEQASGNMYQRLKEISASAWSFEMDKPSGKQTLQLEADIWGTDSGSLALYDVNVPVFRQIYHLKFIPKSGTRVDVGGVMVERSCWEGAAMGATPEPLLGTEKGEVDYRQRPAAFRLFAEKEGYSIEFGGKVVPLSAAKGRDMVKRMNGVHPGLRPLPSDKTWIGTLTDSAGKSRPVKAYLPSGFNGGQMRMLLEFEPDMIVGVALYHGSALTNGWYAYVYPSKSDEQTPRFVAGRDAVDLEHLKESLRFETPEENRWVGYSRDGKFTYDFTTSEKMKIPKEWEPIRDKVTGQDLNAELWRGDNKTDVIVSIVDPPGEKATITVREAADDKKLAVFHGWLFTSAAFARSPTVLDAQPNPAGTTPLTAGKKFLIQTSPDGKKIYAAISGTNLHEGLVILVP